MEMVSTGQSASGSCLILARQCGSTGMMILQGDKDDCFAGIGSSMTEDCSGALRQVSRPLPHHVLQL